jgi:hypothetical protein
MDKNFAIKQLGSRSCLEAESQGASHGGHDGSLRD